jgi:phosphoenolpyruvate carboxykinase (ATP)
MSLAAVEHLLARMQAHAKENKLFVSDGTVCADPAFALPVRVVATHAWHALFAQHLLRPRIGQDATRNTEPPLTVYAMPGVEADRALGSTRSETFIVLHLARRIVLIGGTCYAGEIQKSIYSFLCYLLPQRNVLPMLCSANVGTSGDTALFFGSLGSGRTTLSADPGRRLIGNDEHGWSDDGIFNIEGGCYAQCIGLSRSVLENVVIDRESRRPDYDDDRFTGNTRVAYPLDHLVQTEPSGRGGHPRTILFLACDAFGVLPPIARLSPEQAVYYFQLGYSGMVSGTEASKAREPEARFSACFASPFLPLLPGRYAEMMRQRLIAHNCQVWLVNTGWTGGPIGVGTRIKLVHTRAMVQAILTGSLTDVSMEADPLFGVSIPRACPGVPSGLLRPRDAWKEPASYDAKARHLAGLFRENFKAFTGQVSESVRRSLRKS